MTATLIVTIDTEEEGLWTGRYPRTGNTVENIQFVGRFQALCDRFGIRPTYLVDAPVILDDRAAQSLRDIQDDHRCEIGAHLHPWCNPPFDEEPTESNSFLCNLPVDLQRSKLNWLTDAIEQRFGRRPTSFRAGRYGLDAAGARILDELGYEVDSSVTPFTDHTLHQGPDFGRAPCEPYFADSDDLCLPSDSGGFLEVPVTVGYYRANFEREHQLYLQATTGWRRRFRFAGILDRMGIARRIKFSPEQADATWLTRLIDNFAARNAPVLVMMLHSSSLMPGGSPYVRTPDELEVFYDRLRACFEYCLGEYGMSPATLTEFACRDLNERGAYI